METSALLYVVPTPLGNLGDMTQRAIETLRRVDLIAAEDTRHSGSLLREYGCTAPLMAAHEHNEEQAAEQIIRKLQDGKSVALISDAGTPGISDPGARIVARVREAGLRIVPLPGPCAAITALSAAGFTNPHFLFYGFLPPKALAREKALETLSASPYTLVFYEAPHRILETVEAMAKTLGPDRTLILARELTKMFESIESLPLGEALDWLQADRNRQRGEFVLIVSGAEKTSDNHEDDRILAILLKEKLPVKQIAQITHALTGSSKNALYERALALKEEL